MGKLTQEQLEQKIKFHNGRKKFYEKKLKVSKEPSPIGFSLKNKN